MKTLKQINKLADIFNFLGIDANDYNFEHKTIHKREKHAEISEEDKSYLISKFEYEVLQVEKMLNWDCSDWLK